ncbi:uncharacterized protein MELLADRAFT_90593 [Melampsora larici-populina 98AG31]|uniref:Uncharacterized protein n=1 Tax=Melampsora larici-populina (strain 98AG31 / pathotype 3-4-7) TaxID=747676 RepID=F4RXG4_MELLP|nr:uncharacterized protein MELLADRAFT_90593 [Melampsora larici-populina 98AG31]EGG02991.1 hypothetical protein MELLADRAFT_90593 [Melampsora larici-populina 98AG31]
MSESKSKSTEESTTSSTTNKANITLTAQDITEAKENLGNEIKFDHLTTSGSNFVEWKKNTARAIKALIGIKNYWDEELPVLSYLDQKRDGLATSVINNTIHMNLKNVTDDSDTAYEAMKALQNHFRKGGRTAQFALFTRLMNLRLDLQETEMISHMSTVDSIVSKIESTGFVWNSESVKGLFYQIVMPPEMTKEINKDLDNKYNKTNPNYKLKDIKSAIQIYLARERTASETIIISNLSTQMETMSMNTTPRNQIHSRQFTPNRSTMNHSYQSSPVSRFNSPRPTPKIDPIRWQRGPAAWSRNENDRKNSAIVPLEIPNSAVSGVKKGLLQCFFCGNFGHVYSTGGCKSYNGDGERTGAHWRDWRKLSNGQWYSLNALFPNKYVLPVNQRSSSTRPNANSVEIMNEDNQMKIEASAIDLDWSSEGFGLIDGDDEVPTEYLFDGGATDAEKAT